jgi:uncharacterized repeat protein (TIGR01451 family)
MKRHPHKQFNALGNATGIPLGLAAGIACVGTMLFVASQVSADDGLNRLMKRAAIRQDTPADKHTSKTSTADQDATNPTCSSVACTIPHKIEAAERVRRASHNVQEAFNFTDPTGFTSRDPYAHDFVYPTPLGYGCQVYGAPQSRSASKLSTPGYRNWNPNAGRDEYVFDGSDRGQRVRVDQSWNVHGLETEDTIGHFDMLDGRRVDTPSNRVAIYAPRFAAVRKVDGVFKARLRQPVGAVEEKTPIAQAGAADGSSTTKQHLALNRFQSTNRASGFIDQTRGVVADTVTHLFGVRNNFKAYENLSLMRIGKWSNAQSARLSLGIQSALVWEDALGLQVVTKKISPIIVRDVSTIQELVRVESEDGSDLLRVTKIASKIAARTGEYVDFTIRFDNLSGQKIGNVTIIDNLTRRLEYVPNTAESTLNADFISKQNDGGSLMLRWEIIEPLPARSGGIIRFKCRVR